MIWLSRSSSVGLLAAFRPEVVERNLIVAIDVGPDIPLPAHDEYEIVPGAARWPDPLDPAEALALFAQSLAEGFFGRSVGTAPPRVELAGRPAASSFRASLWLPSVRAEAVACLARSMCAAARRNAKTKVQVREEGPGGAEMKTVASFEVLDDLPVTELPETPFASDIELSHDDSLVITVTFERALDAATRERMTRLSEAYAGLSRCGAFAKASGEHGAGTELELAGSAIADEWVTRIAGFEPEPHMLTPFVEGLLFVHADAPIAELWVR